MIADFWPPAALRLSVGSLLLRPMTEADLAPLAALLPADVEQNPALPDFGSRATRLAQEYWESLGSWRPERWNLGFVVLRDGALVGVQRLEGEDFAVRRTVDSASWLTTDVRGHGIGQAMRRAVLALAFDGLGAQVAETSAWSDNHASIGVSRALGYQPNGLKRHADRGRVGDLAHYRLTREQWMTREQWLTRNQGPSATDVRITNLAPALPFFGLPSG